MSHYHHSVGEYIQFLQSKGFPLKEDAIGFIYFGMQLTEASELLVITAIEITLKAQKRFDGSFYLSLLENMKAANITNKNEAYQFAKEKNIL
ncbi:DUF6123 family protein [Bacillus kwashiorkori]|uniref:DUF6123 family protein n=1 Tax=Bacillus kwashiorkori TaxID=1522318 RepID=UPI0007810261|nr:DUF6123 family protein [Bacillus kwashiorkori]